MLIRLLEDTYTDITKQTKITKNTIVELVYTLDDITQIRYNGYNYVLSNLHYSKI